MELKIIMRKIMEIYTAKEAERKIGFSGTHMRRLVKNGSIPLIENEDYRITEEGTYLYTDTAIEKFLRYKENSKR